MEKFVAVVLAGDIDGIEEEIGTTTRKTEGLGTK